MIRACLARPLYSPADGGKWRGAALLLKRKWPNGCRLSVAFLDGSRVQRSRVQPFFHEWEQYANITFQFIQNTANAEIRVSFQGEGSWSYMGTDNLLIDYNQPTMNLGWLTDIESDAEYRRVVLHECGHVLGLDHEDQQPAADIRWDLQKVAAYYMGPPNNWSLADVHQQVLGKIVDPAEAHTDFDRTSIMAYSVPPEFTLDGQGVPMNDVLSDRDKRFVADMYPKTPTTSKSSEIELW